MNTEDVRRQLADLPPEKRRLLALQLRKQRASGGAPAGTEQRIAPAGRETAPALSFAQERLWFLDQLVPDSALYNIPIALRLIGPLDTAALESALTALAARHETLRTTVAAAGGQTVQQIAPPARLALPVRDLSGLPEAERLAAASRAANQERRRPFDLQRGPLLRVLLLRLAADDHVLLLTIHHIVSDAWSLGVLFRDLGALYRAALSGAAPELPELPVQYADYAVWQRGWLQGPQTEAQLAYWRQQLADAPPLVSLPADRPRPSVPSAEGAHQTLVLDAELTAALQELSRGEGVTLFMTLLAALQILICRYSGQEDVLVGTPVANRTHAELEGLIGLFVNTLVVRTDLSGRPSVRELLARVRAACLDAYAHQDVPFERLVEELRAERSLGHNPLFQVLLSVQPVGGPLLELPGLAISPVATDVTTSKCDLALLVTPADGRLELTFEYSTALFDAATVAQFARHYQALLRACVQQPACPIDRLELLSEAERRRVLHAWNPAAPERPPEGSLHARFAALAARQPEAVALVCGERTLCYGELERRANQLARHLRACGVGPETLVGIALERSVELLVALLAVLKAGGAYVPLDPSYPAQRLAFLVEDARMPLLLTQTELLDRLPPFAGRLICLDRDWDAVAALPATAPDDRTTPESAAYVIYTSGSTGAPKGVVVTHANVLRLFEATDGWFRFGPDDVWTLFHSIAFDFSVWEIWGALLYGGRLVIVPYLLSRAPEEFAALLRRERVTVLNQTPTAFRQLCAVEAARSDQEPLGALRYVIFGGEALDFASLRPWFERYGDERPLLVNMYGITETTVHVTFRPVRQRDLARAASLIGQPIPDLSLYLLDRQGQPVPVGVAGELYVGGAGLARGYLNRPELTAERFVPDPFGERWSDGTFERWSDHIDQGSPAPTAAGEGRRTKDEVGAKARILNSQFSILNSSRLYRTGDLARRLAGGDLEYLGRIDAQIKLRGFRIELGEIEAALLRHPAVREAVALVWDAAADDRRLVGYVVLRAGLRAAPQELRAAVAEHLPAYMVPAAVVVLEGLPLTANGKLDRRALPAPEPAPARTDGAEGTALPASAVEQTVAAVWREVLRLDQVGRYDNFFDLGGHSLLLIQVRDLLQERLGRAISLLDLFRYPSVGALAEFLAPAAESAARGGPHPARPGRAADDSAVAVIGMDGRFPGAGDIAAFWEQLRAGAEGLTFFSDAELIADGVDPALLETPGYVKAYGSLDRIDCFDAPFFGITPREAQLMDPQQRLFLECTWGALEDAGYLPDTYPDRIGVYAGASPNTYLDQLWSHPEVAEVMGNMAIMGNGKDYLATKVAYKLNLTGPALTVQTACSTSLVAVHLACRSLIGGECEMALAGGVSVQLLRKTGYLYEEGGIQSPDGHCRAFDQHARGTVPGDGVGVVVLKRLGDALRDNDHIYAVIKGSAINNDGARKVGYTAPSIEGQALVILQAQTQAGVGPAEIGYVEAHGTGTVLGDPIEIAALTQAFRQGTNARGFCALGSVKTNIGHLDAAAGVAGLIKTALALQHRQIPPSLHFEQANPQIDFAGGPFVVNTALRDWPEGPTPRRAGVSSFGIGGTNAHAVLEEPPARGETAPAGPWQVLTLSARTPEALERLAARLSARLGDRAPDLADAAYTLQVGRRAFAYRRAVVARSAAEASAALARPETTPAPAGENRPVIFLFPGQGAQHSGMARDLYEHEPVFREWIDRCAALLEPHLGLDIRGPLFEQPDEGRTTKDEGSIGIDRTPDVSTEDLRPSSSVDSPADGGLRPSSLVVGRLDQTQYAQPALFVVEYALAQLLIAWGVRPAAMLGHSIGEYVAACLAGVFSLEDALALVAARGRLMQALPSGAMTAVPLGERELLALLGPELSVAAVNEPGRCVVAGPLAALERFEADLGRRGLEFRRLHTSHAFHSAMVEPALAEFAACVRGLTLRPPQTPYISNLSGAWVQPAEATDPDYWVRHMRGTVRFAAGLSTLLDELPGVLIELGPGRALSAIARRCAEGRPVVALSALPHPHDPQPDGQVLAQALGQLWCAGAAVDWCALHGGGRRRVPLPTYPFERQRHWLDRAEHAPRPALSARPRDLAQWCYAPFWKQALAPALEDAALGADGPLGWLVFGHPGGLTDRLVARLRDQGHRVAVVYPGAAFARADAVTYVVDPRQSHGYDTLVQTLAAEGGRIDVVAHLWDLEPLPAPQTDGLLSLIGLAQALGDHMPARPVRIGVVSAGLQSVRGDETPDFQRATLLGACRVLPLEYPLLECVSIDIEPERPDGRSLDLLAELLVAELLGPPEDAPVAYRSGQRWVQVFDGLPQAARRRRPSRLRQGGVYLISGGLGGMGLELAADLARGVRARLVLVGRTALPARADWPRWLAKHPDDDPVSQKLRRLEQIERDGGEVLVCAADVADPRQMADVVRQARARFGAIHGIVHAAGVAGGGIAALQSGETLGRVLAPKLGGLLALLQAVDPASLDFLALFSSIRSVVGGFGMLDYCAANSALDAFVHSRAARATRTLVINWPSWSEVGMSVAALQEQARRAPELLEQALAPAEGLELFRRLLDGPAARVVLSAQPVAAVAAQTRAEAHDRLRRLEAPVEPAADAPSDGEPVQQVLLSIWRELLGLERIGLHDNFFELGGDSIGSLQMAAKAKRHGLRITPRQIFEHPTVAELAARVAHLPAATAEQALVTGAAPLTPIQRIFFETDIPERHHWNQSVLLDLPPDADAVLLERALQRLLEHHDALRLRFRQTEAGWQQLHAADAALALERVDMSAEHGAALAAAVEARCTAVQAGLDLADGPLMRAALLHTGAGRPQHLLLVVHHLAVDIVSWRILLDDLRALYAQLAAGEPGQLPEKTTSFKGWAERLAAHAQTPELERQLEFWLPLQRSAGAGLPRDLAAGPNSVASARRVGVTLDAAETRALLHELPSDARASVNEILLAALGLACGEWSGGPDVWIDVEGHGREALFDDVDLSRTVGWFTSVYPVCLSQEGPLPQALQRCKERLRGIPDHGLGYGLLRYLCADPAVARQMAALPRPEIVFLYLGQLDQAAGGDAWLRHSALPRGPERSPAGPRSHLLEIHAWVEDGRLHADWWYSAAIHRPDTVERLAGRYLATLRRMLAECRGAPGYSPSDFPHANLSQDDLDELIGRFQAS